MGYEMPYHAFSADVSIWCIYVIDTFGNIWEMHIYVAMPTTSHVCISFYHNTSMYVDNITFGMFWYFPIRLHPLKFLVDIL